MTSLVDLYGRPLTFRPQLQTENDSRLAYLRREQSDHPTSGLTPRKAAMILRDAEQGDLVAQCQLAEEMEEKDAHLQSELGKRRGAVLTVDWQIVPPADASSAEKSDASLIEALLKDAMWLDDLLFDATDAILKGFSCQELHWSPKLVDGLNIIENVSWRDCSWFKTPSEQRNTLHLRDGSPDGVPLNPFGWCVHIAKAKTGYLSRIGLVRTLLWPFLYKNYSARDFAEFLEIYGLPMRLGKYPEGATQHEKETLLKAVMSVGHNAGGIIPRGMEIEFQNAANGDSRAFMAMIEWAEKSMSKAILGGTLTSQADGITSTNALGAVHNEVRLELRNADLRRLAATITRDIVYPLYALNAKSYQSHRRIPRFEFDISESEDLNAFADGLSKLVDIGFRIPTQWAHEKLQLPHAQGDEPILARNPPETTALSPAPQATAKVKEKEKGAEKANTAQLHASGLAVLSLRPHTQLESTLDALEPSDTALNTASDALLLPVVKVLNENGLEAAVSALNTAFDDADDSTFEQLLARVIFLSDTLGRLNATTE